MNWRRKSKNDWGRLDLNFKNLSEVSDYVNERVKVENLTVENYISTENMLPNKGGIDKATKLPSAKTTSFYAKGDILLSNIRTYFKKIWYAEKDGGCSNDVLVVRARSDIDSKFLYYVLSNDKFFEYSSATSKGTKMPRGDKSAIMQYQIPDMPIDAQRTIVNVLSALDGRITENKKINHHLEQMIHLNFSNYFSNKSYEKKALGEICSVTLGGTPSRSKVEYWNGTIPWINSGEINKFRIISPSEHITELGLVKSSTKLLPKHTTVLAITGATLGQVSLLEIDSCSNQSVVGVQPSEELPYTFIYPFIVNKIHQLIAKQTGGAQQHINKGNVEELTVPLYTSNTIEEYNSIVEPIFNKISNNCFENERLIMLRDSLLPKLMSGELSVTG